jgi:hypothetical protein
MAKPPERDGGNVRRHEDEGQAGNRARDEVDLEQCSFAHQRRRSAEEVQADHVEQQMVEAAVANMDVTTATVAPGMRTGERELRSQSGRSTWKITPSR